MTAVKLNGGVAERIVTAIENGATREAAAAAGPIGRSTLFEWIKTGRLNPDSPEGEFVRQLDDADSKAELSAILQWRSFFASDWRACAEFLARHPSTRERWRRQPVEFSGPDGAGVTITVEERAKALVSDFSAYLEGVEDGKAQVTAVVDDAPKVTVPRRKKQPRT